MKRFLLNLGLFVLVALILAVLVDIAISSGLRRRTDYAQEVWNDVMNPAVDPEVVVLGNCTALHDFNPHVLDSVLKMDSYVFAMSNLTFPYHNFMWEMLKKYKYKTHSPKLIILSLDYSDLVYREVKSNMENEQFLNLFSDRDARRFLYKHGGYNWLDSYIPCYRYYGHQKRIKYGLMNFLGVKRYAGHKEHYKGYIGLDAPYSFHREWFGEHVSFEIDDRVVTLLDSFLEDCSNRGIQVEIALPPIGKELSDILDNEVDIYGIYESLAKKYGFGFVNYCDPHWMSRDTAFFESPNHLNKKMSDIFTLDIANHLRDGYVATSTDKPVQ